MVIILSKPYYKIKRALLKKDLPQIRQRKFTRFIRRRVPLFMDEYCYAAYAVKKRWGLDVYFFEAGHEQVKPLWLDGSLDELGARYG